MSTLPFAVAFLLAAIWLYHKAVQAARLKAKYKLYAVRDRLVFLVADEELEEENPVFRHYYERLNSLLRATPNVGIDDILHAIFNYHGDAEHFDKAFRDAQERMTTLFKNDAMKSKAVKATIADYYEGLGFLMLTHSSVAKVTYYAVRFIGNRGLTVIYKHLPRRIANVTKTYRFTDNEVRELRADLRVPA